MNDLSGGRLSAEPIVVPAHTDQITSTGEPS